MAVTIQVRPKKTKELFYPESDGKPMAETDLHRDLMFEAIHTLQEHLAGTKAYVSGNLLVYYEEGNPRRSFAPDCFVVFGVEQRRRRIYQIWKEGRGPDVVIEVTSSSTRREDMVDKMELYARLGVQEYFLYDPTSDYLPQPLIGYRLNNERVYQPIESVVADTLPMNGGRSAAPSFISRLLGLHLRLDKDGILQFYRTDTGERVLSKFEAEAERRRQQALAAQHHAAEERRRADEMETEMIQLRAELKRLQNTHT